MDEDRLDVYTTVIIVLAALVSVAGVSMIVVCSLFCTKNRGSLGGLIKVELGSSQQHITNSPTRPVATTGISKESRQHVTDIVRVANESEDPMLSGVIQLLELIESRDKVKIWKGRYNGRLVCVKTFKPAQSELWVKEKLIHGLQSTKSCEFIQQYIGSQYSKTLYLVSQYHPLGSLSGYLQDNTVTVSQALTIVHSISSGLAHLHSNKYCSTDEERRDNPGLLKKMSVAHRDIRSANILVRDEQGACVISDFSRAIILDPNATRRSLMNVNRKRKMGTLQYMSPEALEGRMNLMDSEAFKQIDVYALALVIWEVCSRCVINEGDSVPSHQLPFNDVTGDTPTLEMMHRVIVVEKKRPLLRDSWNKNKVTDRLKQIMIESWDEDPEARLTAANIAGQLQAFSTPMAALEEKPQDERTLGKSYLPLDRPELTQQATSTAQHSEIIVSPSETS